MKTDKQTVFELFQPHRRYVVPIFQRGYVWKREQQWEPLWDDIVAQAAELARSRSSPGLKTHKHFLGALVLNQTQAALRRVPVVEVIDGQQRLTTLQIMLAAIKNETRSLANQFIQADLDRLNKNQEPLADEGERYKVWPTSGLQIHLRKVMETSSLEELEDRYREAHEYKYGKWRPPRSPLVEAYVFFSSTIRAYLDDDPEELPLDLLSLSQQERAEVLVEALIRNVQLVTIELEAEDDAQVIFETLNARGEPLTPSDLVRNFVFLAATREGRDVSDLYAKRWRHFEEDPPDQPFWKQEERQGRLKRSRMDLFLFHYVTFRTAEELKIGHLYQAFRDWWDDAPRVIEDELDELGHYGGIYAHLLAPDLSQRLGRFAYRLRVLDTTTVYPVILSLAGRLGPKSGEFLGMLDDFESYLLRRAVCGYNQKAYNRLFLVMLTRLRDSKIPPTRDAVHRLLADSTAESAIWPDDEEFRRHLVSDPTYKSLGPRRTQMVLEALEFQMKGKFAEQLVIEGPLTVEHVLPQGANFADWPLEVKRNESELEALARRATLTPLRARVNNGLFDDSLINHLYRGVHFIFLVGVLCGFGSWPRFSRRTAALRGSRAGSTPR